MKGKNRTKSKKENRRRQKNERIDKNENERGSRCEPLLPYLLSGARCSAFIVSSHDDYAEYDNTDDNDYADYNHLIFHDDLVIP